MHSRICPLNNKSTLRRYLLEFSRISPCPAAPMLLHIRLLPPSPQHPPTTLSIPQHPLLASNSYQQLSLLRFPQRCSKLVCCISSSSSKICISLRIQLKCSNRHLLLPNSAKTPSNNRLYQLIAFLINTSSTSSYCRQSLSKQEKTIPFSSVGAIRVYSLIKLAIIITNHQLVSRPQ